MEAQELPENEEEAQGKAGKLSGGVQAADEGLPELKGDSESCGRQPAAVGCQGGQGRAVQGPAGRKRSWPLEELKLAGGQCTGGERERTLLRAAAGWSPFRRINGGGAQSRIKKGSEKWERVEEKCKWAQMAEYYKSCEKIGQKQISSPLPRGV